MQRHVEMLEQVRRKQIEHEKSLKEELARKEALNALRQYQKMQSKEGEIDSSSFQAFHVTLLRKTTVSLVHIKSADVVIVFSQVLHICDRFDHRHMSCFPTFFDFKSFLQFKWKNFVNCRPILLFTLQIYSFYCPFRFSILKIGAHSSRF